MLYDPSAFEPLTDEPWDEARVRDGIAAIVADADAAFGTLSGRRTSGTAGRRPCP